MHVLIPVKSLDKAKSRLAEKFSLKERNELVLQMLDHVLLTLKTSNVITKISVVTPDKSIREYVKNYDVSVLLEEKSGYNESLMYAAQAQSVKEKLLSLPADLPLITKADVHELYDLSQKYEVVLAPSKDNGTNALITSFPLQLPYLFGKNSFEKYINESQKRKLSVGVYRSETITFDIDTIEDVALYKRYI